ncbi:MAG: DEAD/DEAH box helicase [Pseudomonadales bacterium]|nr:DEAD/DEAH box helicase [Pseudomonadales bacterium]
MPYELGLLPSGYLQCSQNLADSSDAESKTYHKKTELQPIVAAFKKSPAEGLLALCADRSDLGLPASFRYWKIFANQYLSRLCQLPNAEQIIGLEAPDEAYYASIVSQAPPMKGAEYLSVATLAFIWQMFDEFIRHEVQQNYNNDLSHFLKKRAPHWHQAGRVCFHLAENKNDPELPFAFMATYLPEIAADNSGSHQLLGKALEQYAGAKNKSRLLHLLSPVDQASKVSPVIKQLVESGDIYHPLAWTAQQAYQFLSEANLFENCGIQIRLPNWWRKRPAIKVSVTLGTSTTGNFNVASLLDFDVKLAIGEHKLTAKEWQKILANDEQLVFLNKQWVEVNKEQLQQALAHWQAFESDQAEQGISFIEAMRLLAGTTTQLSDINIETNDQQWSSVQASKQLDKILSQIRHPDSIKATRPGKALKASLRPYQAVGVNWLWYLHQLGLGACLADDMGLGKTIQIIALLLILKKSANGKPSLIVLPTSLLNNWQEELARFAPSIHYQSIHPSALSKQALTDYKAPNALSAFDVILTSYSMLQRQDWLFEYQWQLVVLDEAQAIKNPGARQTRATKRLQAQSRIALTGTPVENRLSDLWSLFDFTCPGLLGNAASFKKYTKSLDTDTREGYAPLRKLVQPYILRRLKTDKSIISDLPDKTEVHAYCHLSKLQAALYNKTVRDLTKKLASADGMDRRGLVLSHLLRFKQICNHPAQLLGDGDYSANKSGKLLRLGQICEEISARQEKVLVFTQFREMCEPLSKFLADCFKQPGLVLHGNIPVKKRQKLVSQFQQEDGPPFFILSLKAGGTGLNLTAASHVIHFDRWWNPAVENQATDRAFRIGQKNNVLVHKFVCPGTIEEKIDTLIEEKKSLATNLLQGDGAELNFTEMSNAALIELVSLDLNKAQLV